MTGAVPEQWKVESVAMQPQQCSSPVACTAAMVESIFNQLFSGSYNTILSGGALEPLYLPADEKSLQHRIFFREDYFSSALHEIAHWCIAGEARRHMVDFGYWYKPDGRNRVQQRAFENVEIKPQALEWIFSTAAGITFYASADNLSADDVQARGPSEEFLLAVENQVLFYCQAGLPDRAGQFACGLGKMFGVDHFLDPQCYRGRYSRRSL